MLPYLGRDMYPKLLEMTRRYHKAENPEQKINEAGNKEETQLTHKEMEMNDDTLDEDGDKNAKEAMI